MRKISVVFFCCFIFLFFIFERFMIVAKSMATIEAASKFVCPKIISREEWKAREVSNYSPLILSPAPYLVIHHGGIQHYCYDQNTCSEIVRSYQNLHMDDRGWLDIGYQFVIGEDGNIYEGRGWNFIGAHAPGYNTQSIGISIIGDFSQFLPNKAALDALDSLIECGVLIGKIRQNYKIIGHRQARDTDCPGISFYQYVKSLPGWTDMPNPFYEDLGTEPVSRSGVPTWPRSGRVLHPRSSIDQDSRAGPDPDWIFCQLVTQRKFLKMYQISGIVLCLIYILEAKSIIIPKNTVQSDPSTYEKSSSNSNIITRSEWGAKPPKGPVDKLSKNPPPFVVVHHSATEGCTSQAICQARVRSFQDYHINHNNWSDIGYNFLVGEDGNIYEGRGWSKRGAHSPAYNAESIGICVIGDFTNREPNSAAIGALKELLQYGVTLGEIKSDYYLIGHRQASSTNCPGNKLYNLIKTWPHWESNPKH
ncbi:uncharacterized protein LOC117175344 [Belonocnema kinseyi]|uniref:uncharacterized protein LOC117175344 n=1 Tax=Belonocnema kinseyi TaxID=2817044 RepID=UPI00143CE190|nr:uncharacterized protein LOC117175344 [Belonocnema kinseyi]